MKLKPLLLVLMLLLLTPSFSFGFGLLQYVFDGVKNQLGLDRGPIPKVLPYNNPHDPYGRSNPQPNKMNRDGNRFVIQADGF